MGRLQYLRQFYFKLNQNPHIVLKAPKNTICGIEPMESNSDFQFGEGIVGVRFKSFYDGIMESGAKLPYFNIVPGRMDSVGEQHHNNGAVRFHPEGGSGVAQMTTGTGGKATTGRGTHR